MNGKSFSRQGINTKWIGVSGLLVMYDIVAVNAAYFLALWLRFDCRFSFSSISPNAKRLP